MRGRKPKSCAGTSRLGRGWPGRNDNKPQGRKRNTPTQCKTMICIKFLLYTREVTQVQIKFHFVQTKSSEQSKNWACQRILSTSQIDSVHSSSIIVNDLCLHRQVMEQTHGVKVTQPTGDSYLTGDNLTERAREDRIYIVPT